MLKTRGCRGCSEVSSIVEVFKDVFMEDESLENLKLKWSNFGGGNRRKEGD